ncbi:MAG: hypothetical protein ACOYNO_00480 [Saprospiraceae bacterium]
MKNVLMVLLLTGVAYTAIAQKGYDLGPGGEFAAGVRLGGGSGLTLKKYHRSNLSAFEVIADWNFDEEVEGFGTTILFEKLAGIGFNDRLCAQFGFGAAGVFGDEFRAGPAATIGFDWRLGEKIPIGLQLDWTPSWLIINDNYFSPFNAAVSARWVF